LAISAVVTATNSFLSSSNFSACMILMRPGGTDLVFEILAESFAVNCI
jgi:hypothetical protein